VASRLVPEVDRRFGGQREFSRRLTVGGETDESAL
jgi:hypothetical protein